MPSKKSAEATVESLTTSHEFFSSNFGTKLDLPGDIQRLRVASLMADEYADLDQQDSSTTSTNVVESAGEAVVEDATADDAMQTDDFDQIVGDLPSKTDNSKALVLSNVGYKTKKNNLAVALYEKMEQEKPQWHAPWKLMRVVAGHGGWVRCVAVDPSNEWFVTGSADRTIKIWEMATGRLKLSLTGHINAIRGLAVSTRSPFLFSAGDDKTVKCWDLEANKVVRQYHGHLSGVYSCALHPALDVLITGSRDATARVWDIRTKACVHVLSGHRDTIWAVSAQAAEPQVITGSADHVVRTWDLATGKTMGQLTHHKKQVRALAVHPTEYSYASAGADNIKKWKCPESRFMLNFSGHNSIVNTLACNGPVMFSGGDNGSMRFWDWRTGYCFQRDQTVVQPGSLDAEAGIFASTFDMTGSRLITCEADKTIKFWKEDETATEQSHPIDKAWRKQTRAASQIYH